MAATWRGRFFFTLLLKRSNNKKMREHGVTPLFLRQFFLAANAEISYSWRIDNFLRDSQVFFAVPNFGNL